MLLSASTIAGDAARFAVGYAESERINPFCVGVWVVYLIANGLWLTIRPEGAWRFRHMFSFKHPEKVQPSTTVMVFYRVSGVVCIALGIGLGVAVGYITLR